METKITPVDTLDKAPNIFQIEPTDRKVVQNPITLHWENINVHTPDTSGGITNKIRCRKVENNSKHIIRSVNGVALPGTLMAIMGASGAGKTTLLNVINFRNRGNLKITGEIKINGTSIHSPEAIASMSGYVQQEDMFIGFLKVKEQLTFQAMMRMDKSSTKAEKRQRVEEVMSDLNLKKCENTLIGIPDKDVKGISGGERRRLAFACEMITNPNLLFFDEPTSGLDSFMAMSIVDSMKKMALLGKTIICTIHQPSSEIFEKFDRLCLLAEGRLAYIGDLNEAGSFFNSQGFPLPNNYNPADFYINTLAIVPSNKDISKQNVEKICDGFQASGFNTKLNEDIKTANVLATNPKFNFKIINKISYKVNFFTQLVWLFWRSGLTLLRDPFSTKLALIQTVVIAVLLGLIFLRLNYDQTGIQNMNGILFLLITNTSFSNMFAVINSFTAEIPIFIREHQNGMYSVLAYYLSKFFVDLPKFVIMPFIFVTIVYWMSNLNPDVGRFFICVAIIILTANCSVAFGCFLSAVAPSANAALGLAGPVLVPLMIFSGFFLNNTSVPAYFIWLKYLSWFNYTNELLQINQWRGLTGISCPTTSSSSYISSNSTNSSSYSMGASTTRCITTGDQVLSVTSMNIDNYAIDFIALTILFVGWRFITFLVLLAKSYRK